jgi:hypothetical protein
VQFVLLPFELALSFLQLINKQEAIKNESTKEMI